MKDVFEKTRELGQALIESEAYQNMKAAEENAYRNAEAADTMSRYLELRNDIQDMLAGENPDSAALKSMSDELDSLQEKLNMIEDVASMTEARSAFSNLIAQVNQVLQFMISGKITEDEPAGCGGGCSSCGGGCHHVH
ncbi:MAG: YlbF family regulator [Clostridiales bacterium]|nr:YlbF family regulator [Clostridiales bacterium]